MDRVRVTTLPEPEPMLGLAAALPLLALLARLRAARLRARSDVKPLRAAWLAALALSLSACLPVSDPIFEAGGVSAPGRDGLQRVRNSGFRVGWIRQDSWARAYDEIQTHFIGVAYRSPPRQAANDLPGRDDYALPSGVEKQLMASLEKIFGEELGRDGGLPLVHARGPRVLLARVALVDLVLHVPLGRFKPDEFLWIDSAGELSIAIELRDSTSGVPLARFLERAALAQEGFGPIQGTPGPVGFEARRIFRSWARSLRLLIDAMRVREVAS
ncbi:MAG: DUF3313 family protein [Myxococcales bacterium]|nr:MAG: DUF3313 family protein [Myxococcales bacterium]